MAQVWHDLLFAHWPVAPEFMRSLVPAELSLDVFEGHCWVGVVPFWMSGVRPRGLPAVPGLSTFPELNVRTYVTVEGKPGVYFFSLDAASRLAVWGAKQFFHLPYFFARMSTSRAEDHWITYESQRARQAADLKCRYRPTDGVFNAKPTTLEHFLTERYCLYTIARGDVLRCEVHHAPWDLQNAEAEVKINSVAGAGGITLPQVAPHLLFSRRQEVIIWPLRRV